MAGRKPTTARVRFDEKCISMPNGCLIFTGKGNQYGYGEFLAHGKRWSAHRWSFTQAKGPIPDGLFVCHQCDTPNCVRPAHLFLGTQAQNIQDASRKGRINKTIKARGEDHGNATLTNDQVREMRRQYEMGLSAKEVAAQTGYRYSHVYAVVTKITYRSVN